MRSHPPLRSLALAVAVTAGLQLAMTCGGIKKIRIDAPADMALVVDAEVSIAAVMGKNFDVTTTTVEVNGVDLVAALALTPPFTGQGGMVMIGPDLVTVSNFAIQAPAQANRTIDVDLDGLSLANHQLEITAFNNTTAMTESDLAAFELIDFMTQVASAQTRGGPLSGPLNSATEGSIANVSIGQALAGPPIATVGGDEIRSGFIEVAEQIIGSAGP